MFPIFDFLVSEACNKSLSVSCLGSDVGLGFCVSEFPFHDNIRQEHLSVVFGHFMKMDIFMCVFSGVGSL